MGGPKSLYQIQIDPPTWQPGPKATCNKQNKQLKQILPKLLSIFLWFDPLLKVRAEAWSSLHVGHHRFSGGAICAVSGLHRLRGLGLYFGSESTELIRADFQKNIILLFDLYIGMPVCLLLSTQMILVLWIEGWTPDWSDLWQYTVHDCLKWLESGSRRSIVGSMPFGQDALQAIYTAPPNMTALLVSLGPLQQSKSGLFLESGDLCVQKLLLWAYFEDTRHNRILSVTVLLFWRLIQGEGERNGKRAREIVKEMSTERYISPPQMPLNSLATKVCVRLYRELFVWWQAHHAWYVRRSPSAKPGVLFHGISCKWLEDFLLQLLVSLDIFMFLFTYGFVAWGHELGGEKQTPKMPDV